jgi:hypothetical protein
MGVVMDRLFPEHSQHYEEPLPRYQGRSKKKLRPVVEYRGGIYVAQWKAEAGNSLEHHQRKHYTTCNMWGGHNGKS